MLSFKRAHFECDDDPVDNLVLDLVIDTERRRWVEKVITGGWWGRIASDDIWPLILREGGVIDFGTIDRLNPDGEPRRANIDLSDRILAVGEPFKLEYGWTRYMTLKSLKDVVEALN